MNLSILSDFYERLQDEESRIIFSLKYEMLFKKGYTDFIETLLKLNYPWKLSAYDDFRSRIGDKKVVIFGAGIDGRMTYDRKMIFRYMHSAIMISKSKVLFFVDAM